MTTESWPGDVRGHQHGPAHPSLLTIPNQPLGHPGLLTQVLVSCWGALGAAEEQAQGLGGGKG